MGRPDVVINAGGFRFVVKRSYDPPYLWVQKFRPRARDWETVAQMDVDADLIKALQSLAKVVAMEGSR